jgi:S-adenosylmethionine uptake transporter
VLFFKNAIGWRRLLAILVGFGGMMLIVRPGSDGFDVYSIYVLIAVLCVTARDLTTRAMSKASSIAFCHLARVTFGHGLFWHYDDRVRFHAYVWLDQFYLLASAFFIIGGYAFSVWWMRVGDISFVALFRYSAVIWTLFIGLWVLANGPMR